MKISTLFLFLLIFCLHAENTNSQNARVTIKQDNIELQKVLNEIELQTNYLFVYDKYVNVNRYVSINSNKRPLKEVLGELFEGTDIKFSLNGDYIVLSQKESKEGKENTTAASINQQGKKVIGIVKDATGAPIIGANIVIKGTTNGTITDVDGKFSLSNVKKGDILEVSYIGYITQNITLNGESSLRIALKENSQALEEVVVVGYGTQKKVNLTGAVESVGSEKLENRPTANLTQSLEGAVPNLTISLADGKPTRSSTYQIRGTSSIGQGGSALVLIDGVEGDPSTLNPNDVASVSILKDAAASAIYGARGTFGVVLITTKSPTKGHTTVNYSGNFIVKSPTKTPDLVTDAYEWAGYFKEASFNYQGYNPSAIHSWLPFSDAYYTELANHRPGSGADEVVTNANGSYSYYGNTDWYDLLYKDRFYGQEHNMSVQGGNDKADFLISGRYYGQGGLYTTNNDKYHTYNLRAKGDLQVYPWLQVRDNFEYTNSYYYNPLTNGTYGTVWNAIVQGAQPMAVMFNPDGTLTRSAAASVGGLLYGNNWQKQTKDIFRNTAGFTANFLNNKLKINGDLSFRYTKDKTDTKMTPTPYSRTQGLIEYMGIDYNYMANQLAETKYLATNLYAEYAQKFAEAHDVKLMVGWNYEQSIYDYFVIRRQNLLYKEAESIALANGTLTSTENYSKWRIAGGFFRANYGYKDRYLLEVNGRYDGSSKFPDNQQWGFFPSASVGWRVNQEPWWKVNSKGISDLKLRASYGSLGNGNIGAYAYQELFYITQQARLAQGAQTYKVSLPAAIPSSLTWETATTANFGLDAGFLDGNLRFTGDYYIRKTKDMYTQGTTLPGVFGAASPKGNYADMTTKGWEITLSYNNKFQLANKPFHYEIIGTLGDYKSVIDKFNNATKSIGAWPAGTTNYYKGMTVGEIWGLTTEGFFTSKEEIANHADQSLINANTSAEYHVGDIKFKDLNGDGVINYGDNTVDNPGDRKVIGNSLPRYNFSIRLSADWNNFFVSAFFQGVGKQDWYTGNDNALYWGLYARPYGVMPKKVVEQMWSEDNQNTYFPRLVGYQAAAWDRELAVTQTKYLENIAYIRLKNLQFGYNLPKSLVNKLSVQKANIFVSMDNLWNWSPLYKHENCFDVQGINGEDTESLSLISNGWYGQYTSEQPTLTNNYPILRSVSLGVSVTF